MNWDKLTAKAERVAQRSILSLFSEDHDRQTDFSIQTDDLYFDYAKTNIDGETREMLLDMAARVGLVARRKAKFSGALINETEGRAVLHTALRNLDGGPVLVEGVDVMPSVRRTLERMGDFAEAIRAGEITGAGGAFTDIVNIGIGGSDLGPAMALEALRPYHDGPRVHFVSNVDGAHITDVLRLCDPATTLLIIASKTFTTVETMTNANTARAWMRASVDDPGPQMAALSSALDKTAAFGIDPSRVFGFEDWVGGRYSLWGPIGLSLKIAIGRARFEALLRGAQAMDHHFCMAEGKDNMPLMLALVGIWHNQGCGYATRAVLPYEQRLLRLPAYLQQLEMESNGKSVAMDGKDLMVHSGPVVWGEPGTNGQHAFYQLIHQGSRIVPCEFMVGARGHEADLAHHHVLLMANCLAQSEALLRGRGLVQARALMAASGYVGDDLERQARHRVFSGNRPSTTLCYEKLTPYVLGQILALYEHRVFVEGVILGLNSFDQWGVELGKELAKSLEPVMQGHGIPQDKDGSTRALAAWLVARQSQG